MLHVGERAPNLLAERDVVQVAGFAEVRRIQPDRRGAREPGEGPVGKREGGASFDVCLDRALSDFTICGVIYLNSFMAFLSDMLGFVDTDTCLIVVTL